MTAPSPPPPPGVPDAWITRAAQRIRDGATAARLALPPAIDGFGPPGAQPAIERSATPVPVVASALGERLEATWARLDANPALAACFLRQDREGAARHAAALAGDAASVATAPLAHRLIAHKDLFAQEGALATFAAAPQLQRIGVRDATALLRMRAAGAVDLGGLHLSELAMGPTGFSETFGSIDNPAHPGHASGGSSSGSAAVVAAGLVDGALGTDTGGSIRVPAAFCGVVGMKPSRGLVCADGVLPLSRTLDCVGPLARDVATAAAILDVLAGHLQARGPHAAAAHTPLARKLSVGVLASASLPSEPGAEVAAAMELVVRRLASAGCTVREIAFPELSKVNALAGTIFLCEGAAVHGAQLAAHPEWFGPQVRYRLLQGAELDGPAYVAAREASGAWLHRWNETIAAHCDVLLLPVAPTPAPLRSDDARLGDVTRVLERNAVLGSYAPSFNYLGLPVMSLPLGGTLGVQVVGKAAGDVDLVHVSAAIARILAA